jgi:hypothetical protein
MATLGDILGSAKRSAAKFERWAEAGDPELIQAVKTAAVAHGDSLGGYLRVSVADFSRFADEEAWAQLSRVVRDSDDPGMACLGAMARWRMAAPVCEDHVFDVSTRIDDEHRSAAPAQQRP